MHKHRPKHSGRLLIAAIILPIFIHLLFSLSAWPDQAADDKDQSVINFTVKNGDSLNSIAPTLAEKNLIRSALFFKVWLKLSGSEKPLQSGIFPLSPALSPREILAVISDPAQRVALSFTVPEGYSIAKIDEKLSKQGLIKAGDFIRCAQKECARPLLSAIPTDDSLEGYLFPDTYFLNPQNFHSQVLLDKMLNNFQKKWNEIEHKSLNKSIKEIVIVASLIEKEVKTDPDRPLVAGIIWQRLQEGWPLGIDATTVYHTGRADITSADLRADNAYNTRLNLGLPPTAIGNPGLKSLIAALNPEFSRYRFYLTEPVSGRVIYAQTNDEHNANRARYLR